MLAMTIGFANLLLASLVVGAMFGVWLFFDPTGLDAKAYVALHHQGIRTMNVAMPAIGGVTTLLTIVAAVLARDDAIRLNLLIVAVVCFVGTGLITRLLNQPINAVVMTWSADAPPDAWTQLRDKWWRWHIVRLIAGIAGLSALIVATMR